jgi:hypothetical protein
LQPPKWIWLQVLAALLSESFLAIFVAGIVSGRCCHAGKMGSTVIDKSQPIESIGLRLHDHTRTFDSGFRTRSNFRRALPVEGIVLRNAQMFLLCSIPRSCNKLSGRRRFEAPSSLHHYSSSLPHSSLDLEIPSKHKPGLIEKVRLPFKCAYLPRYNPLCFSCVLNELMCRLIYEENEAIYTRWMSHKHS